MQEVLVTKVVTPSSIRNTCMEARVRTFVALCTMLET